MSKYFVIQYYPDLIRGERINVAVVVWNNGNLKCRLIENFDRVKAFAGDAWSDSLVHILSELTKCSYDEIAKFGDGSGAAMSCLQRTPIRAVVGEPEAAIDSLAQAFLA